MKLRSDSKNKPSAGIVGLLVALLLAIVVGGVLSDANGKIYVTGGSILWGSVLIISFMVGWVYFSRFILPISGREGWDEGLRLLGRNYLLQGRLYLDSLLNGQNRQSEKRVRRVSRSQQKAADDETAVAPPPQKNPLPPSFKQLRAGIVRSHQALAINKGMSFARPAGPGFISLYKKEYVADVIDLRPHLRLQHLTANTRDGIPVTTTAIVIFRIRQNSSDFDDSREIYPYDRDAVFQASYASRVDQENQALNWTDIVAPKAASLLAAELTHYTLDQLYQDDGTMARVYQSVKRSLSHWVDDFGIELVTVSSTFLKPPDDVQTQRLKNWQSGWQRQIFIQKAASQAEAERRIKRARARAQVEIIEHITQNIAAMRHADETNLTEIITLRMIEALEEAITNDSVRAMIPQRIVGQLVMDTSAQMRSWLQEPPEATP